MKAGLMSDGCRIEIEVKAALAGWSLNRRFVRPRYSVSPADYLQRSCDDLTRTPKKLKTYRRIFDTIFFGGLAKMQDATHQRLAMETAPEKPRKRKKKCFFLLLKHPIFCQKGQKKALFFCQYVLF